MTKIVSAVFSGKQEGLSSRQRWGVAVTVFGLFALAALFRLADLSARNLWTDEAWVALAVLQPSVGEVLASGHSTPPLYLLTIWALAQVFGSGEAVLRALSLCFGLGTVFLFWPLARSLTATAPALLGLTALTFSPIMVYYSKELKQYSGDAFFAVLVLLLTERLRVAQGDKGWLLLGLAGMVGLGYSHTLVFILPVALASLWFTLPAPRRRSLALIAVFWGAAFALLYSLFLRHQVDPELVGYWSKDFPDFSGLLAFLIWLGGAWQRYLTYFLGEYGLLWGGPLLALGVIYVLQHKPRLVCVYLAGPLLLAFSAAALHRYPFMAHYGGSRLMLFSAPMLYLLVAAGGVAAVLFLWRHRLRWLTPVLIGGILIGLKPAQMVQENLHPSFNRSQLKPLVARLERERKPNDWVYVYYYAIHPFKYYFQQENLERIYWGKSCVETGLNLSGEENINDKQDADHRLLTRRLWLISGHYPNLEYMNAFAASLLGPGWRQTAYFEDHGAVLYRFERQETAVAKSQTDQPALSVSGPPTPAPEKAYK